MINFIRRLLGLCVHEWTIWEFIPRFDRWKTIKEILSFGKEMQMNRENPECPLCNQELNHEDVFGRILRHQDGKIIGDIYRCENEECEGQGNHYYTYREGDYNLHEGYPC